MTFYAPPIELFHLKYQEYLQITTDAEPSSMVLATCTKEGAPSCRVVLLKQYNNNGFIFFTNIHSRKGRELQENNQAALLFHWRELKQQIRIEGHTEIIDDYTSDHYFASRSFNSNIIASCSQQSRVIENLDQFYNQIKSMKDDLHEKMVPRPKFWLGIRVVPKSFEFWTEGVDRLHIRDLYLRDELNFESWKLYRIYP